MKRGFSLVFKNWYWVFFGIIIFTVSCKDNVEQVNPVNENARIIKLLKDRGFIQLPTRNARIASGPASLSNVEDLSFDTYEEAEAYVNALDALDGSIKSVDVYNYAARGNTSNPSEATSSLQSGPCGEDGYTYYIDAATSGLFSDVNIVFQRSGGTISSVSTNVSGSPLYTWAQQAYSVFTPYTFCIDSNVTFGIQVGSLPTNWSKRCILRTYLDTGGACNAQVLFKWGKCSD